MNSRSRGVRRITVQSPALVAPAKLACYRRAGQDRGCPSTRTHAFVDPRGIARRHASTLRPAGGAEPVAAGGVVELVAAKRKKLRTSAITSESPPTSPKPFVFVPMPFDEAFRDIYLYGIRESAKDVGAYAERVDDQVFDEGILERILNQINKADVIVADMTGKNSNVSYEVGYAHALNKVVILLTQNVDDIPFDLKHRHHIEYGGRIERLRPQLTRRLEWALAESRRRNRQSAPRTRLAP